ncbi:penicillin-binding transpeptidase domain-containing protein [Actinorugispora endophytica]|uniref:penicillin-binding transpeptidase domain-containing protein n=1 Tax=Actinorugispora endophytica TaxID=1605990 RepID=UPI001FB79F43|nr:penicillin-binding transpeptidase domain-containing protein [Actinorugispora endophytica]
MDDRRTPSDDQFPPPTDDGRQPSGTPVPPPGDRPPRRSRRGLVIGLLAGVVVLALVGGGASWYVMSRPRAEATAALYTAAWNAGNYAGLDEITTDGGAGDAHTAVAENLGVESTEVTVGEVVEDGDTATAPFTAALSLGNGVEWGYEGELPLERVEGEWKIAFTPAVVHPRLGEGQTLARVNAWGERGRILAADGTRLDTEDASGSIQMLTGTVGTVTAEDLSVLGPAYAEGDPTGKGGVQQAQEERLAGTPTTRIQVVDEGEEATAEADESAVVGSIEGSPGQDVTLSIDPAVQQAASNAIISQDKPTALVAIRPSTGEILAAANVPGGFNRAVEGQYPAGSTFKIVSYDALLRSGMTTGDPMNCPKTADVGGWPFKNAGDAEYGAQSMTEAFATSCNTALVQEVADRLDADSLVSTAESYGFNSDLDIGVPSLSPSFPAPDSTTLLAAMSIGQGQMLTSPLHMATVPAAVADGSWRSPVLVTDPALPDRPEPTPIDNAEALRPMMRAVVTEGTAKDVGFAGEVYGKSGTAEYGTAEEGEDLPAHGWFVGYEGDVAFAVLVEDGNSGSGAAAPLAKRFLDGI